MDGFQLNQERNMGIPEPVMPEIAPHQEPEMQEQPEQIEEAQAAPQPQPTIPQENPNDRNIRALREKAMRAEQLERELEELKQRSYQQQPDEDLSLDIRPDELAEGKHLSKVDRKVRKLEEQIRQYQQQTVALSAEARLKSQYPDFDSIVTQDNLNILKETKPSIYRTIQASHDIYDKAVTAYEMIKQIVGESQAYAQEKQAAQINAAKPRPVASIAPQQGDSPMSRANAFANGLTDELKEQLLKEMTAARKFR